MLAGIGRSPGESPIHLQAQAPPGGARRPAWPDYGCGKAEEVLPFIARHVAQGRPRQIHRNCDALPPCVVLPAGAALDDEAGVQRAAPRRMGRMGIERLFRLVVDARCLFGALAFSGRKHSCGSQDGIAPLAPESQPR